MDNINHPTNQDDAEIEIIDLNDSVEQRHEADPPLTGAPVSLRRQLSQRQKVWRLTSIVGAVVLALTILLGSTGMAELARLRSTTIGLFTGATPTPTPDANAEYFYFDASPSWGRLSIDGQTIQHVPVVGHDEPLYLSPGQHRLLWMAEPFALQNCLLTVPVSSNQVSGACPAEPTFQDEFGPLHAHVRANSWQVFFYQSLKALTSARRAALIQAVQAVLDTQQSTEMVYAGEPYLLRGNMLVTATQPLYATLHFQLDTPDEDNPPCIADRGSCSFAVQGQMQNCLEFCTQPAQFDYVSEGWYALAIMHAVWDYTTPAGRIVAQDQPAAGTGIGPPEYPETGLQITWDGRNWHVRLIHQEGGALQCQPALNAINAYPSFFDAVGVGSHTAVAMSTAFSSEPAQGCLLLIQIVSSNPPPPSPSSSSTTAYCLYRFGILLAANDLAHHYWPAMPLVDKYERGLVQAWIGHAQG